MSPNGIKKLLDETFGPPGEGIKALREFTSGETGKRLDKLLARIERLSKDTSALPQVIELMKVIQELDRNGGLERLNSIMGSIPKGKTGQSMVKEVRSLVSELSEKLDKISNLASTLLSKED